MRDGTGVGADVGVIAGVLVAVGTKVGVGVDIPPNGVLYTLTCPRLASYIYKLSSLSKVAAVAQL